MILYHGSPHKFEWPDYNEMVERTQNPPKFHPRGLWVTTDPREAAKSGEHIYRITLTLDPVIVDSDEVFDLPRHKLFDAMKTVLHRDGDTLNGLIVDLDMIEDFELAADQVSEACPA